MKSSGLISVIRSRRLGGHESDPTTYLEVLRTTAEGSGSAAWVLQVFTIHEWFMSYVGSQLQEDVYGVNPDAIVVDSVPPSALPPPLTADSPSADGGAT
jgi:hypothetical protein|tara:strand:+ start:548 stop:844 length:297 start_codon:yes stop_codon:yes gene_type:complete